MKSVSLALLASLLTTTSAIQFPPSCSPTCQHLAEAGSSYEATNHADPSLSFYTVPSNFSPSLAPGTLLKLEPATQLTNFSIPSGLTLSRILYTTTDLNGTILPTSAYILWPYLPFQLPTTKNTNPPSPGGYPLVAWAHGTTGLFPPCAPSNYRNLQYHFMVPFLLALQGAVVVAPDYAGLGVSHLPSGHPIPHPWLAGPAQAHDLANAIIAARSAFPSQLRPSGPFVAMGHSQGGSAAWAFAERQATSPVPGYRGSLAIAPSPRNIDQYELALANHSLPFAPINLGLPPKLIAAVTAVFPAYNFSGLTDLAYERWNEVLKPLGGCFATDTLVFSEFQTTPEKLAKVGWEKDGPVRQFKNLTDLGKRPFKGPLVIYAADVDEIISYETVKGVVGGICGAMKGKGKGQEELEFVTYRGSNHFPIIQASQQKWLAWVKEKLFDEGGHGKRGGGSAGGCKTDEIVEGFRQEFTFHTFLPNFLDSWVDPDLSTEGWKYI